MRKLIEKGKQFLKKLEDDNEKKKNDAKMQSQRKVSEEEQKESMMSKTLDNEKMFKLGQLLLTPQSLPERDLRKLQESTYFRTQLSYHSINQQLRKCSHEIDFQSSGLQQNIKQACENSEQIPPIISQNPLFLIGVVGFHHKKGSIIEFYHPSNMNHLNEQAQKYILDQLPNYCMTDAIHNKNEDYVYFTLKIRVDKSDQSTIQKEVMLFGVSYFKQIEVNEKLRENDKELTRSHVQKSLFVLSTVPLQGYIMGRLEPTTKVYFEQERISDYEILVGAYENMNQTLKNNQSIEGSELYIGTSLKTMIYLFKEKSLVILKALLLQKKILVYSQHSCSTSNFIMSLLSLVPGLSFFKFGSKHIDVIQSGLNEYGLPLRLFNDTSCPLNIYFTIQELDKIEHYDGYLIGTTNQLIRSHKKTGADLIVDLDSNTLNMANENIKNQLQLNSDEKKFMENITKTVSKIISEEDKDWKNKEYSQNDNSFIGSNDWIRQQFAKYIIDLLCEIELIKKRDFQKEIQLKFQRNNAMIQLDEEKINKKMERLEQRSIQKKFETHQVQEGEVQNEKSLPEQESKNSQVRERKRSNQGDNNEEKGEAKEEDIMNELLDEFINFDLDDEHEYPNYQQQQKMAKYDQFDSEALMGMTIEPEFDKTQILLKQTKKDLKVSYKSLQKYNLKFLREFFQTESYKYWHLHHDESIAFRSVNYSELTPRASLSLENGSIYFGSMQNGERFGKGNLVEMNIISMFLKKLKGSTFDQILGRIEQCDNYEKDMKNGHTTISTLKDDYFFEGDFVDDKREGFGNLVTDKIKFSGNFSEDKMNGQGSLVDKDESIYEGEFVNNMKCGMGKFRNKTGSISYVGQFYNDKFCGKGQLVKDNGEVYCGDFKLGEMHGQGEYQTDSYTYNGEFVRSSFTGQGIYKNLLTNDIFQGEFKDNILCQESPAIIKYHNGDVFSGTVLNWQPHGEGLISYKDGHLIKAIFENGQIISIID